MAWLFGGGKKKGSLIAFVLLYQPMATLPQ
jgi:hypothetical protein